ncbi:MAG: hypothetical protein ABGY96_28415 [bacterium]|nr:hypothetical protein [Gammaproteobacteria bacterium]HIL95310.1 hypothetical protein [Pseudomonadales bacterium]
MSTDYLDTLGRLEASFYEPLISATEEAWKNNWISNDVSGHDPLAVALIGGALADRPAWIFHAGYQGMMRYAFPFCPKSGWASYLVAEDKTGEYSGTVIAKSTDSRTVSGFKNWVAASGHVDHLIVQVTGSDENTLLLIDRNAAGVALTHRESPGFLADMSQGFAAFDEVNVTDDCIFSSGDLPPNFAQSEPLHVLTALNAFMVSQTLNLGGNPGILTAAMDSLRLAGRLVEGNATGDDFFLGVADLDASMTETARSFEEFIQVEDIGLHLRWRKDRGLVKMFSRGLQKRAKWLREN